MKKTLFVMVFAAFSVACSENGAGVSAGSSSTSTADTNSILSKNRAIAAAEESAKTIQMPAIAVIAEAFTQRIPWAIKDNARMQDANEGNPAGSEGIRKIADHVFEMYKNEPEEFAKQIRPVINERIENQFKTASSTKEIGDALVRLRFERRLASCSAPMDGWEYSPMNKDAHVYMKTIANACDFTNLIFTELAGKIGNRALNNPSDAIEEVLKNWDAIPIETLEETWKIVVDKNNTSQFSANLTGVKGVQFTGQGGMYWNQGGGFVVSKNSAKWFGDGTISGKVIDFNLRSSLSTKTEKTKSQSSSQGQQSGSKTGAEIGIK